MPVIEIKTRAIDAPLFEAIATPAKRGTVDVYWLGQAGFAFRSNAQLILIDPYLSNFLADKYKDARFKHRRMMPTPLEPDEARGVDLLLATHGHSDHLDPGSLGKIMALNPECRLVCPKSIVGKALERGADRDRIVPLAAMEKRRFDTVVIEMLPSAHEELEFDADGNTLYAGFILDFDGVKFYHSGDCVPFVGQTDLLRERQVDIAMLPVNGRDAQRGANGVPGNFSLDEAARLCLEADITHLVPCHFGLFDFNTISLDALRSGLEKYRDLGLEWSIPEIGSSMTVQQQCPAADALAGVHDNRNAHS